MAAADRRQITKPGHRRALRRWLYQFPCEACRRRRLAAGGGAHVACGKCGATFLAAPVFVLHPRWGWRMVRLSLTRSDVDSPTR